MSFGQTIRKRREGLDWTLEDLAERADLSPNYIGTIENGRRDPSVSTLLKLAKAFRVAPGDLTGGAHELTAQGIEAARLFDSAC